MEMGLVAAELQTARNIAELVAIAVVTTPARDVLGRCEAKEVRPSDVTVISSTWMWFTKLLAQ